MGKKGEFQRIDKSDQLMYGPRGILVCGYSLNERDGILELAGNILGNIPVIFGVNSDVESVLGDLFGNEHKKGLNQPSDLPRAIIMSGLSNKELHALMGAYRDSGMPAQIWASLTPTSKTWTLKALLVELLAEARAMRKKAD